MTWENQKRGEQEVDDRPDRGKCTWRNERSVKESVYGRACRALSTKSVNVVSESLGICVRAFSTVIRVARYSGISMRKKNLSIIYFHV